MAALEERLRTLDSENASLRLDVASAHATIEQMADMCDECESDAGGSYADHIEAMDDSDIHEILSLIHI